MLLSAATGGHAPRWSMPMLDSACFNGIENRPDPEYKDGAHARAALQMQKRSKSGLNRTNTGRRVSRCSRLSQPGSNVTNGEGVGFSIQSEAEGSA